MSPHPMYLNTIYTETFKGETCAFLQLFPNCKCFTIEWSLLMIEYTVPPLVATWSYMKHGVTSTTVYIIILIQSWSWWICWILILFKVTPITIIVAEDFYVQLVSSMAIADPLCAHLFLGMMQHSQVQSVDRAQCT